MSSVVKMQLMYYKLNRMVHFLFVVVELSKAISFFVSSMFDKNCSFCLSSYCHYVYGREGPKVSHYIINVTQNVSKSIYKIGDKTFLNMKELLTFYKQRLLDTSPLVRIVSYICLTDLKICKNTFR